MLHPMTTLTRPALAAGLLLTFFSSIAHASDFELKNHSISWSCRLDNGKLLPSRVDDRINGDKLPLAGEFFQIVLADGAILKSSDFTLTTSPAIEELKPDTASPIHSRHLPGRQLTARYTAADHHLSAEWRVILREETS